ncbi:hypothetical protein SDJN03_01833, partial [Cucurbita argyrosperma subsp. sororia]
MAGINLISAAAAAVLLVLASIFNNNIPHTQGLRLLPMEQEHPAVHLNSRPQSFHPSPIAATDVDVHGGDFRPTTPGHSPGAGHGLAPDSHVDSKIH